MFLRRVVFFSLFLLGFGSHFALSQQVAPTPENLPLLSGRDLQEKINKAKEPLVLDFWAVWCGPCQAYSPVVHELSKAYAGKIEFYKVDVSDRQNDQVVQDQSVQAIPTLLIFENGEVVDRLEGVFKKADLKKRLDQVLRDWVKSSTK